MPQTPSDGGQPAPWQPIGSAHTDPGSVKAERAASGWRQKGGSAAFALVLVFSFVTGAVLWRRSLGGDNPLAIAVIGLTPWLLVGVPVTGVATMVAWGSRRWAGIAAAVLWLASSTSLLAVVDPVGAVVGCGADDYSTADTVTVYTHNVLFRGGDPDAIAQSIVDEQADIVLMQEVSSSARATFESHELLDYLPYRSSDAGGPLGGMIILSRWPLLDAGPLWLVVSDISVATVDSPWGEFALTNLHTLAPARPGNVDSWQAQFAQLAELPTDAPQVIAGDFNATKDHRPMRTLLSQGWTDAHDEKGCGIDNTWPLDQGLPFPLLRLDHVLVTDHFEVLDLRLGQPNGSDHRPVVAELRFG